MEDNVMIFGGILLIFASFLFGMWQNIYWRVKILRQITKKNYILINLSERGRTIKSFVREYKDGEIRIGNKIWIIERDKIYMKNKPQINYSFNPNDNFSEDGIPAIYLDSDSLMPIQLDNLPQNNVSSDELSSFLVAWLRNREIEFRVNADKNFKKLITYVLIGICLVGVVSGYGLIKTLETNEMIKVMYDKQVLGINPVPTTTQDGKIIIDQTKK